MCSHNSDHNIVITQKFGGGAKQPQSVSNNWQRISLCYYRPLEVMEEFGTLDFELNNLSFSFKEHDPLRNSHSGAHRLSYREIREAVLQSPRMKTVIREVSASLEVSQQLGWLRTSIQQF